MSDKIMPKKWYEVYPNGTAEGDEEYKFFIALARSKKYTWRSTSALVKETKLSQERVEEIIQKYHKLGLVFQNNNQEESWAYWENCPERVPSPRQSLADSDHDDRMKKAIKNP